ncbi:hypothetical protein K469DRAFT_753618 [Zopfia rhizophila CBS 207.26]|uniref:Secreted protein n=1 Tax=Zopfia rhizophila CBS 207.26 TaxID=1314779 RepID=A0A6A6DKW0_9PEZI|nr:hypothetical protein K469DRAFT_753618 [Zopfia rhizophila CBS 207.26]
MLLATSLFPLAATSYASAVGQLSNGFQDPSSEYRAKFRYWMPDASVSSDLIAKDFRDAKAAGAGGLEYLPFYLYGLPTQLPGIGTPTDWNKYGFGTPAFSSQFKDALKAAKDAGIVLDYALGANQGQGVPSEPLTFGLAVQLLMGNTTITPKGSFLGPIPQPQHPPETISSGLGFMHALEFFEAPKLAAVIAYQVVDQPPLNISWSRPVYLNQSSFIDLTEQVNDGTMQWTPPDISKTWKIFTFWEAYTNQKSCTGGTNATDFIGNGSWITDHFSKAGAQLTTDFWDQYLLSDPEIRRLLGSVGKYAWEDSMEMLAVLYWTPGFLDQFKRSQGYDLVPYLPMLFNPSNTWNGQLPMYAEVYGFEGETSPGIGDYQLDYRKVLNDGYQAYISHFRDWSHSLGTEYSAQVGYNVPVQMLSDIQFADAPEGESFGFGNLIDAYRQFASPAHLANKSVVSTELGAVNVAPYSLRVPDLLQQIKRSFAGGFTMNVIHGFPTVTPYFNTTWPGYTAFFYMFTDMWNSIQPAWQHMSDSLDYIGRNQFILQQGTARVDLAFYFYAAPWYPRPQYNSTNLQDLGYTYDYLGPDNLASDYATIHGSALGVPAYKALIFSNQTVITVAAVDAIADMASSGLPVIFVGEPPNRTYPETTSNQAALAAAMSRLLSDKNVHRTDSIDQLPSVLAGLRITPRVSLDCSSNPVYSVWRSSPDMEYIYFFNDQNEPVQCTAKVAASRVTPNIYSAWKGTQSPLLQYTTTNSTVETQLNLKSNETMILALHRTSASNTTSCAFPTTSGALQSLTSQSDKILGTITGPTVLTSSSGKTWRFDPILASPTNLTTWDLIIEDWHSAPDRHAIETEITNHTFNSISLKPWNQLNASLENVSGVGHYSARFTVPSTSLNGTLAALLHLPLIQHTARAYLNNQHLPPIDPVNPVLDLTGLVEKEREYEIRIDVTTTLFNRIKSEADDILIVGVSAGSLQPAYKNMEFEGYGLVGDVWVEWGGVVEVDC